MKHVCNFSGGLCSFWAAYRVVQKYGPLDTVLLFADTLVESPDLYEFNQQASALLGVPVTRVSREMTPWQLFRREKMIGNNRFPICSVYLKREVLDEWLIDNFSMGSPEFFKEPATLYLGFDWTEGHRVADMRKQHPDWRIEAPMTEEPIWDKCRMQNEAAKLGLPIAQAYMQGFPHNNCGKRCVRGGISHWVHLYHVDEPAFAEWEKEERFTAQQITNDGGTPWSMLKDRRGGVHNNLYLWQLRQRIEAGELMDKHDWGGCGCGGTTK